MRNNSKNIIGIDKIIISPMPKTAAKSWNNIRCTIMLDALYITPRLIQHKLLIKHDHLTLRAKHSATSFNQGKKQPFLIIIIIIIIIIIVITIIETIVFIIIISVIVVVIIIIIDFIAKL